MNKVCLYCYLFFYCLLAVCNGNFFDVMSIKKRQIASKSSCHELIKPFLGPIKYADNYDDIFKKGYLALEEVNEVKSKPMFKVLVEKNSTIGEDQDFAYAVLAFIKKKYPRLSDEATALHYEAILRFCI
jgi:hypothetical protein